MALKGKGKRAVQAAVDNLTPFDHGKLSAREVNGTFNIFSYRTPVAWFGPDGWHVTDRWYSVTTSNHVNVIRTAVANPGFYTNARW